MRKYLLASLLLALFCLSSVSALVCDSGDTSTVCIINNTQVFVDGENFNGTGDLVISNAISNTTQNISGTAHGASLIINFSNIIINGSGSITGGSVTIYANNLTMASGRTITTTGLGYLYDSGPGKGGTGGGGAGSGAGHGGTGGQNGFGFAGGPAYGSSLAPNTFGSGGGSGATAGMGGGIVTLLISDTLNLTGTINVSGTNGAGYQGGGSGGSIYAITKNLFGTGSLTAIGGNGGTGQYGGGGAGGRIAVYYNLSSFTGISNSKVTGGVNYGAGAANGGTGSLIFVDQLTNSATLSSGFAFQGLTTIANETLTPNQTFWNSANPAYYAFSNLTINSGTTITSFVENLVINVSDYLNGITGTTLVINGTTFSSAYNTTFDFPRYSSLNITSSSISTTGNFKFIKFPFLTNNLILSSSSTLATNLNLTLQNLTIANGCSINANGLGYSGSVGAGNGAGPGGGTATAGGAGHGGLGGNGQFGPGAGVIYGSSLAPTLFGSGGASSATYNGGHGGGIILLNIADTLNLTGTIINAGGVGTGYGGGGSGGSIYAITKNLIGTGNFSANGGSTASGGAAGGGAGGRIAVYYNTSTFTGISKSRVTGGPNTGSGGTAGNLGTVIFVDSDDNTAIMPIAFRFQNTTSIANESTNTTFWNSSSPTIWNFNSLNISTATISQAGSVDLVNPNNLYINGTTWTCTSSGFYLNISTATAISTGNTFSGCGTFTSGKATYNSTGSFDGTGAYSFDGVFDMITSTVTQTKSTYSFWYKNLTGAWTFVVNTGGVNYTNGVLGNPSQYPINVSGNTVIIGRQGNTYFSGMIDEFKILPYNLTAGQVLQLYNVTVNNSAYIGKYFYQGSFDSLVFYNSTSTYWNTTLSIADTNSPASGIVNNKNEINLSNPNLVSYWALDGNTLDATGRNNGTAVGGVNNATGISSGAMRFDGVDDYILATRPTSISGNTDRVISLWIYPKINIAGAVFSIGNSPGDSLASGLLTGNSCSAGKLRGFLWDNDYTTCAGNYNLNDWNHIVLQSNSSHFIWLYINGVLVTNRTSTSFISNQNNFYIASGYSNSYFNGTIDEVLIYNSSLTQAQITQLYKSGLSQHANTNVTLQYRTANSYNVSDSGLVALWGLNNDSSIGETATKFVDSTGRNNGTCSGTACPTVNNSGVVGNAMRFDGVDDYINVSNSATLNINNSLTISVWIYPRAWGNDFPAIISKRDAFASMDWQMYYNNALTQKIQYSFGANGAYGLNTLINPPLNSWSHIIITRTGNNFSSYLNGVITNSTILPGNIPTGDTVRIGTLGADALTYVFNGSIDEVRIYNRSLSASEVANLYQLGSYHISDWTAWTNATQITDGVPISSSSEGRFFQFKSFLNSNDTDISPYIINYSIGNNPAPIAPDGEYPQFNSINFNYTNGSQYNFNNIYEVNVTITSTNGTAGIEFNGVNYTLTNVSSLFSYTLGGLGVGTYPYYFWGYGNGTLHLFNNTEIYYYDVVKTIIGDGLLGLGTYQYPFQSNVNITENNEGDGDVSYNLFRDDILVASPDINVLGVGTYHYLMNSTGGANYSSNASIAEGDLVITQNNSYTLTLSASPSWIVAQGIQTTITGSGCLTGLTCNLYRDGLLRLNPSIGNLGNGTYVFVYNTTGNVNYSYMSVSNTLNVTFNFTITPTTTVSNQTLIYGEDAPYIILGYGIKFNNGGFLFKGHGIQFS